MSAIAFLQESIFNPNLAEGIAVFIPSGLTAIRADAEAFLRRFGTTLPQTGHMSVQSLDHPLRGGIAQHLVCVDNGRSVINSVDDMRKQIRQTLDEFANAGARTVAMNGIRCNNRPDQNTRPETYQKNYVKNYLSRHPGVFDTVYLVDRNGGFNFEGVQTIYNLANDAGKITKLCQGVAQYLAIKQYFANEDYDRCYEIFKSFYGLNRQDGFINEEGLIQYWRDHREDMALAEPTEDSLNDAINAISVGHTQYSFATKVLHTLNNDLPIWDKNVARFTGFTQRSFYSYKSLYLAYRNPQSNGLENLVTLLRETIDIHAVQEYANDNHLEINVSEDDINNISTAKIIDFMIWSFSA